jgi:hypothetical protein
MIKKLNLASVKLNEVLNKNQTILYIMKKTLFFCLFVIASLSSYSQSTQKTRFGIKATPSVNWMVPNETKKLQNSGSKLNAGIGLVLEFPITDVVSFQTGLDITTISFNAKYNTDTAFYIYKDDAIIEAEIQGDSISTPKPYFGSGYSLMRLKERTYKTTYLNIPLTLKMKTKDIGGFTYFGQIGGNLFGRLSAVANDLVEKNSLSGLTIIKENIEVEKVDITKTVNVLSACGNIGAGFEYNISGSTSLFASVNYQHHFMNATKADSGYLIRSRTEGAKTNYSEFQNGVKLKQIVLSLGILF